MSKPIALHTGMLNNNPRTMPRAGFRASWSIGGRTGLSRYICTAGCNEWATCRHGNGRMAPWEPPI